MGLRQVPIVRIGFFLKKLFGIEDLTEKIETSFDSQVEDRGGKLWLSAALTAPGPRWGVWNWGQLPFLPPVPKPLSCYLCGSQRQPGENDKNLTVTHDLQTKARTLLISHRPDECLKPNLCFSEPSCCTVHYWSHFLMSRFTPPLVML